MRNKIIKKITLTAILAAMASILYFFIKFPLPFFPSFLEINFSMIPIFLGGYMMGPTYGTIIAFIRFLIKVVATHTAGVGELADLIIGVSSVLISSFIYSKYKTKKGALVSLGIGTFTWILISFFTNWLVLVPSYIELYFNGNVDAFISILSIIPGVNNENYMYKYLLYGAIPFNTLLSLFVCTFTFFVYKPLHRLVTNISNKLTKKS